MNIFQRVRQRISELIGASRRIVQTWVNNIWTHRPAFDWNRVDYAFYDRLRRGQAEGLEKSGLLLKPVVSKITAWVMGRAPEIVIEDNEELQSDVNNWWAEIHSQVQFAMMEAGHLGDCFIVFNGDGTLTVLPPDIVFPIVADEDEVQNPNEVDYSKIIGWRVIASHAHPYTARIMRIIDEYFADVRIRTKQVDGVPFGEPEVFPNPLGIIPFIHVPANRGVNDRFGRPYAEAMLPLLHDYGQVLDAGLDGNIKQGRPVFLLEFDKVSSLDAFWNRYGKIETYKKSDGTPGTNEYLDVDMNGVVTMANAKGEFKSPASSSSDTVAYLEILYYLYLEYTELPEFLMGTAIASSKASAEVQMPPFIMFIELMQSLNEYWLLELARLAVAYLRVTLMRSGSKLNIKLQWPQLTDEDNRLTLDTIKWAHSVGLIDDENAVRLMPVEIENPEEMLKKLDAEAEANQPEFTDGNQFDNAMQRDANQPPDDEQPRGGDNPNAEMYNNGNGHHKDEPISVVVWS